MVVKGFIVITDFSMLVILSKFCFAHQFKLQMQCIRLDRNGNGTVSINRGLVEILFLLVVRTKMPCCNCYVDELILNLKIEIYLEYQHAKILFIQKRTLKSVLCKLKCMHIFSIHVSIPTIFSKFHFYKSERLSSQRHTTVQQLSVCRWRCLFLLLLSVVLSRPHFHFHFLWLDLLFVYLIIFMSFLLGLSLSLILSIQVCFALSTLGLIYCTIILN